MTSGAPRSTRIELELETHRRVLHNFVAAAKAVPAEAWNQPRAGDKWSPAQIAEHLRLSYLTLRAELAGKGGFRIRARWWQQRLFRLLVLPAILNHGRFPPRAPATREIRPGGGPFERQVVLGGLVEQGDQFIHEISNAGARRNQTLTHPFFGKLSLLQALRLATQHIRHHHGQLIGEAVDRVPS